MNRTDFAVATAPLRASRYWSQGKMTWGELREKLCHPADRKECGSYLLGTLRDGLRRSTHLLSRSCLTLDIDHPASDFLIKLYDVLSDYQFLWHTTWRSAPDEPRYRILVPLDCDVYPDLYSSIAQEIAGRLGIDQVDPASFSPVQYMFWPSAQNADWYQHGENDGRPLPTNDFKKDVVADDEAKRLIGKNKRDPFAIEGVVGAFNRAHDDWQELIETYSLPYEKDGARWHLVGAKSVAGMGVIAPGIVYSHHANDPAFDHACSAFDLVRLHRFGSLDEKAKPNTPVTRLPSYRAMLDLAAEDADTRMEMVKDDFSGLEATDSPDVEVEEDPDDDRWRGSLILAKGTGKPTADIQNRDLIARHDPVLRTLQFNKLTMQVEMADDPPWRTLDASPEFSAIDSQALGMHLEREYHIELSSLQLDALVNSTALRTIVHPVKDYLEGLKWDGKHRMEYCLPGAEVNDYTRLVARRMLIACVARVFEPGVKWDHVLILCGPEGLKKTWWTYRMSRGFYCQLGRLDNKDTLLAMHRSWWVVSDEAVTLDKARSEEQKEFFTRTEDVFRVPYGRAVAAHPRSCIFWGTTNDLTFLRRQEGNRRYVVVPCFKTVDPKTMEDGYIDQVWAEALCEYRAHGLQPFSDTEMSMLEEMREPFVEEDDLTGRIQNYLDTRVPERWSTMSPENRILWLDMNKEDPTAGDTEITQVCSTQIWDECLRLPATMRDRAHLLAITNVLKSLPGWRALPRNKRLPFYGPQLTFVRTESNTDGANDAR